MKVEAAGMGQDWNSRSRSQGWVRGTGSALSFICGECGKDAHRSMDPKGARSRSLVRNQVIPLERSITHSRNLAWLEKMNCETL